jgi:hypothetical protein
VRARHAVDLASLVSGRADGDAVSWTDMMTPWAAGPAPAAPAGWTVEGVVLCPGECGLYFDFNGTPQDLQEFISKHDCAFAQMGEKPR